MFPLFARSYLWSPTGKMGAGLADQMRPAAAGEEWELVDSCYRDVSTELRFGVYVLLTAEPAMEASEKLYVFLEPFANLALAVDRERGDASICADWWMWKVLEAEFRELIEHVGSNVRAGRTVDALVEGLHRLRALLGGDWRIEQAFNRGGDERAVITKGQRIWKVTRGR